jgi:hypothetical protein
MKIRCEKIRIGTVKLKTEIIGKDLGFINGMTILRKSNNANTLLKK